MKSLALETEKRPICKILAEEDNRCVIYLTKRGKPKFALVPLDDGDEEVRVIRCNAKLTDYLDACERRARRVPCKTLEEVEAELGIKSRKKSNR